MILLDVLGIIMDLVGAMIYKILSCCVKIFSHIMPYILIEVKVNLAFLSYSCPKGEFLGNFYYNLPAKDKFCFDTDTLDNR